MEGKLNEYIYDSLKRFIQYHIDQGYSKESLVKCLKSYGYSRSELSKVFHEIHINPKKIDKTYSVTDLDGEAYYYLRGTLSKYMKDQERLGFQIRDVKEALIKYGHKKELVNDAYALLVSKKEIRISRESLAIFGMLIIGIFTFIMANTLNVSFMTMFRLISPAFITIVILYILADQFYHHKIYVPVFSIALSIALFLGIIGINNDPSINDAILLLLNAGISTIVSIAFIAAHIPKPKTFKGNSKKKHIKTHNKRYAKKDPTKITKKEIDIKKTVRK